jgi:hypothetical protein
MPKFGIAKFRDLSGPTNPTGILSPAFLMLKQALDGGDSPENVTQALYDWLAQRKITPAQVDKFLDLEPDQAFQELIKAIGGGLVHDPERGRTLPPLVVTTLKRALAHIAGKHVLRSERELGVAQNRLSRIKSKFAVESAQALVDLMLDDQG